MKKKIVRAVGCLVIILALFGGILGVDKFAPEQREIEIIESISLEQGKKENIEYKATGVSKIVNHEPEGANGLDIKAKSAILIDASSGKLLYSQNSEEELPPASVTKIMTMLLILEAVNKGTISLEDEVTISERAASMGGSQMYMEPGEIHTLDELMRGIAMVSANDGCVAAAEHLCGTVEIFVEEMNKRAKELGMNNTNFVNTNGLPAINHYSSAKDIAIMSRELLKYTSEHDWFTTWQTTIKVGLPGKEKEFGLTNTNKLIKQYNGANGIKTGFTTDAGYCLAASATRDDMTLIAVVLGCESSKIRTSEISRLLDYGFGAYDIVNIADKGQVLGCIDIKQGRDRTLNVVTQDPIKILVKKGEQDKVTSKLEIKDDIIAPIKKGTELASLVIFIDGVEWGCYDLLAEKDVEKANFLSLLIRPISDKISDISQKL